MMAYLAYINGINGLQAQIVHDEKQVAYVREQKHFAVIEQHALTAAETELGINELVKRYPLVSAPKEV